MQLSFDEFNLENSTNCSKDYLEIRDGDSSTAPLIGRYCGDTIPKTLPSYGDVIYLHFVTDNSDSTSSGFVLSYTTASFVCGGALTSPRGVISSPNYPKGYLHNYQCEWKIVVNKGSYISLQIIDMDIEQLFNCDADYLEIFEGLKPTTKDMMKFCGTKEETTYLITHGNSALVRFVTDDSLNGKGFKMFYRQICSNILTDFHGGIESPNYPESYPENTSCIWKIKAPKGNKVQAHFSVFDLRGDDDESFTVTSGDKVLMNSTKTSSILNSWNEELTINFVSPNGGGTGFYLEYEIIGCVATFTDSEGTFTSPNYPDLYNNDMNCHWQIKTEFGRSIVLTIEEMDLELSDGCKSDFVKVSSSS